jgi:hypothetical protein
MGVCSACGVCGACAGFGAFLYYLEAPGMGGILFRPDEHGKMVFSQGSLMEMLRSPFTRPDFWTRSTLWPVNWVLTTTIGACLGAILY